VRIDFDRGRWGFGLWQLVFGNWSLVFGYWSLGIGLWVLEIKKKNIQ
jgi:hypothetical protein